MLRIQPEWGSVPPHWLPYFAVVDCDASADRASENGAAMHVPPTDIPQVGRFAVVRDPQGAAFAIIALRAAA
jgi:predicted enzyme related to lactoylglutathione lyase